MGMLVFGAQGLRISMTSYPHNLLMDKRAIGTNNHFASSDIGFTASAFHSFDQNFIHC